MAELYMYIATCTGLAVPVLILFGWASKTKRERTDWLLTAVAASVLFLGLMIGECL